MRIGVIGGGNVARTFHIPTYLASGHDLVGVCDTSDNALDACRNLGLGETQLCADLDTFLKRDLDAVSVCVPNYQHKGVVIACLRAGAHVLCEKPPAMNANEVSEMISVAKEVGRILTWQFNNRFRPDAIWLWEHIWQIGSLGNMIKRAQVYWERRDGIPMWGHWFTQKALSGGGPIIDLLIHMLDLALYAMNYPTPKSVMATTTDEFGQDKWAQGPWGKPNPNGLFDVETAGEGVISFGDGMDIVFGASWAKQIEQEMISCAIQGTEGGALLERTFEKDGDDSTAKDKGLVFSQAGGYPQNTVYRGPLDPHMGRMRSVQAFLSKAVGDENNPDIRFLPTADEAEIIMTIIDAIYASAAIGGEPVKIE